MEAKLSLVIDHDYNLENFLEDLDLDFSWENIFFANNLKDDEFDCDANVHIITEGSTHYELNTITVNIDNLFLRINNWHIWSIKFNILFPFLKKINKLEISSFIEEISIKILDYFLYLWLKAITKNKICDINNLGHVRLMLRNYRHKRISLISELCGWPKLLKELSKNWRIYLEYKKVETKYHDSKRHIQSKDEDRLLNIYERIVNCKELRVIDIFEDGGEE